MCSVLWWGDWPVGWLNVAFINFHGKWKKVNTHDSLVKVFYMATNYLSELWLHS
jgi:hypothetical protein